MRYPLALLLLLALPAGASETILVVGDSHTAGAFGLALDDALRAAPGARVATFGVCSARPQSYFSETPHGCGHRFRDFDKSAPAKWLGGRVYMEKRGGKDVEMVKTPELAQLLSDHHPSIVVVALGSNLPISGSSVQKTLDMIHLTGAACVWIGPPDMRNPTRKEVDAVYATLDKNNVSASATLEAAKKDSCILVDSRAFSYLRYPADAGGGTHYDGKLAGLGTRWGADAAKAVLAAAKP